MKEKVIKLINKLFDLFEKELDQILAEINQSE